MLEIIANTTITSMCSENPPSHYIKAGETFIVHTKDCFADKIIAETDSLRDIPWSEINPCTGPIFIYDAEPGDILKISIINIDLSSKGILLVDRDYLHQYGFEENDRSIHVVINDGNVFLDKNHRTKIKPMIGTVGVAPERGSVATTNPGEHGGNMDCSLIGEKAELYLPVFHTGALLSLGDVHAVMGDGEFTDCGVEVAAAVTIKIDVLKNKIFPTPMVISENTISAISSAETLDEAAKGASSKMLRYLLDVKKLPFDLAWGLMCTSANSKNCQFVNELKTVRCEMPMHLLE